MFVGPLLLALASSLAAGEPGAEPPVVERTEAAFALLEKGMANEAASAFESILEDAPADGAALEGRVRSLLRLERWTDALAEARAGAAASDVPLTGALAEALFRAGRLEELDRLFSAPSVEATLTGRGRATLGRLRDAQGRQGEAVEAMRRAVGAAPQDRDVLYWGSGASATRAEAVTRLEAYLARSEGDDPSRIEAAQGWIALMQELGERRVWIEDSRPERLELPLQRIWDPATGAIQGFVLAASIGDRQKPVKLLLDTGSPGLYVIRRLARKHDFTPLSEQSAFGGGGSQRHRTTRGLFPRLSFGELSYRDALATSNKQELDPTGRYHGLIGLSAFHGYRVTLDLESDRLLLEPPAERLEGEPYWVVSGQLVVRAGIEGPEPGLFLFDTGATHTLVDRALVAELEGARLGPAVALHGFGGLLAGARRVDGLTIVFQGLSPESVAPRAVDLSTRSRVSGLEISGFLGLDLLGGRRVVVDTTRQRVAVY